VSPLLHPLLLEREAELEGLAAAFGWAEAGEGSLVVVEGPTGVGKSDLLVIAEDMALDRGFAPLLARGSELERDFPFGVVLQLLERLITSLAPREREALLDGPARVVAPLFPTLRPAGGLDAEDPYALVHGTSWLIARLADRAPLALMVDDAQWIDERSLEVLRYLAARIADLPVVVVVAGLPERTPDGPLAQLAAAIPPVALTPSRSRRRASPSSCCPSSPTPSPSSAPACRPRRRASRCSSTSCSRRSAARTSRPTRRRPRRSGASGRSRSPAPSSSGSSGCPPAPRRWRGWPPSWATTPTCATPPAWPASTSARRRSCSTRCARPASPSPTRRSASATRSCARR
jgi:hypothetical protein